MKKITHIITTKVNQRSLQSSAKGQVCHLKSGHAVTSVEHISNNEYIGPFLKEIQYKEKTGYTMSEFCRKNLPFGLKNAWVFGIDLIIIIIIIKSMVFGLAFFPASF